MIKIKTNVHLWTIVRMISDDKRRWRWVSQRSTGVPGFLSSLREQIIDMHECQTKRMTYLFARGPPRRGSILCIFALLFLLALYQLGIICSTNKEPNAVMVAKEVRIFSFFSTNYTTKSSQYIFVIFYNNKFDYLFDKVWHNH